MTMDSFYSKISNTLGPPGVQFPKCPIDGVSTLRQVNSDNLTVLVCDTCTTQFNVSENGELTDRSGRWTAPKK
jgi:hypothetical protein